jgi:hypothetical protein
MAESAAEADREAIEDYSEGVYDTAEATVYVEFDVIEENEQK